MLYGVPAETLSNTELLYSVLRKALERDNFNILGENVKTFTPEGVTITFTLGESHAALHTYHEHNSLQVEISSCRGPNDGDQAIAYFKSRIPHTHTYDDKRSAPIADPRKKLIRQPLPPKDTVK